LKIFFNDIFWDFLNIHLNIIVLRFFFKILMFLLKTYLKYSKNILRVMQWSKGACVVPNSMVGPKEKDEKLSCQPRLHLVIDLCR
jgi:hypothetical protein